MAIVSLTFVLTLTIVFGGYWALVMRPEAQTIGRLRQRLQVKMPVERGAPSLIKGNGGGETPVGFFARWHQRLAIAPTERLVARAGMNIDPRRLVRGTTGFLIMAIIVLKAVQPDWTVALVAGAITPLVPYFYLKNKARVRLNAFEEAFPDAVDLMARALRAGHALTTTIAMVAEEIPDPVSTEFRAVYEQHNYGLPFPQVLKALAVRIPLMDVRFFVIAVLTQRETGGNLAEVLDNLGKVTRDRFRVRQQLRALTAQGRMTGWVLSLFPIALAAVLFVVNPSHMLAFTKDPLGVRLLEAAAALQAVGIVIIRKIVRVEY
jgi:tight adherence protein B